MSFKTLTISIEVIWIGLLIGYSLPVTDGLPRVFFSSRSITVDEPDSSGSSTTLTTTIELNREVELSEYSFILVNVIEETASSSNFQVKDGIDYFLFKPGDSVSTIEVTILHDKRVTDNLIFKLKITNATYANNNYSVGSPSEQTVTIQNIDSTIGFRSVATVAITEGETKSFSVIRNGGTIKSQTVLYSLIPSTPQDLTFDIGVTEMSFSITARDNSDVEESPETISVEIGKSRTEQDGTFTLRGGETQFSINFINNDVNIVFLETTIHTKEGQGNRTVSIARSGVVTSNETFQVSVTVRNDSAKSPFDFALLSPSVVSFGRGDTSKNISIDIKNNHKYDANLKYFTLTLNKIGNHPGLHVKSPSSARVQIATDDAGFSFQSTEYEVRENGGSISIPVRISSSGLNTTRTVRVFTIDGNATAGTDYVNVSRNLEYNTTGLQSFVVIVNDTVDVDGTRQFSVAMEVENENFDHILSSNVTTVKIKDDDVIVKFERSSYTIREDQGPLPIKVLRSGATDMPHTVQFNYTPITATQSSDFIVPATITFLANEVEKNLSVTIVNDLLYEPPEAFAVNISSSVNVHTGIPLSTRITITNDDTYIYFCSPDIKVSEDSGSFNISVCRTNGTDIKHTVSVVVTGGRARENSDFTIPTKELEFTPGVTNLSVQMILTNDDNGEDNETVTVALRSKDINSVIITGGPRTVMIYDDDNTFSINDNDNMTVQENSREQVRAQIVRAGKTWMPASVRLEFVFSSAVAEDCSGSIDRNILFSAGEDSKIVTACTIEDDNLVENDETFKVKITGLGGSNVQEDLAEKTIKIISDDVYIDCQNVQLNETHGNATIVMTRSGAANFTSNTISCFTLDGTAHYPTDYSKKLSNVTFYEGDLQKEFNVRVIDDSIVESDEALSVHCTTTDDRVSVKSTCIKKDTNIDILDNDIYVECPTRKLEVIEGTTNNLTITVNREGFLQNHTFIGIAAIDGTAIVKGDYVPYQEIVTFAPGVTNATITIMIVDDDYAEDNETFNVTIEAYPPMSVDPTLVVKKECATVLIKDNDSRYSGITDKQIEEVMETRHHVIVSMAVAVAFTCVILIAFIVLVYLIVRTRGGRK